MNTPLLDGIQKKAYAGMYGLGYGAVNRATGGKLPESAIGGAAVGAGISSLFPLLLSITDVGMAPKGAKLKALLTALKGSARAIPAGILQGGLGGVMGDTIAKGFMRTKRMKSRIGEQNGST